MPLIVGKSPTSFSKNVATEMHEGKPLKQSLAIAYAMKKKAQKEHMAKGGMCVHGKNECEMCHADGGFIEDEESSGYEAMPEKRASHKYAHAVENQGFPDEEEDMVSRIMKHRYSHGGKVANEDMPIADFEENEFDDLPKDDDLEFSYTGANSGDEHGDEAEDEEQHDVVSRIMKSRRKKDRLPRAGIDLHA